MLPVYWVRQDLVNTALLSSEVAGSEAEGCIVFYDDQYSLFAHAIGLCDI